MANEIHSIIWSFTYAFGMGISGFVVNALWNKIAFYYRCSCIFTA